jgi:hypothetical protein
MEGERILIEAVEAYRAALGERLLAAYALGSLAHGGFSGLVSDVDLGLILRDPLDAGDSETIQAVAESERRKGSALHGRLSVFWGTPTTIRGEVNGGRFPPADRLDLVENGRLLLGDDVRSGVPTPSRNELVVAGAEFALNYLAGMHRPSNVSDQALRSMRPAVGGATDEIRSPHMLFSRGVRRVTKLVLFPVRFIYTAATGRVATNHNAVAYYVEDDQAPSAKLVTAALSWRVNPPADKAVASKLLAEELLPLYIYYIEDHIARLYSLEETDLITAFQEWRDRLAH